MPSGRLNKQLLRAQLSSASLLQCAGALDVGGLRQLADAARVLLLAPKSRGGTWDLFQPGGVGPDAALKQVFPKVSVLCRLALLQH